MNECQSHVSDNLDISFILIFNPYWVYNKNIVKYIFIIMNGNGVDLITYIQWKVITSNNLHE